MSNRKYLSLFIFSMFLSIFLMSSVYAATNSSIVNKTSVDNGQLVKITTTWQGGTAPYNAIIYFTPSTFSTCSYTGVPLSNQTGISSNTVTFIETPTQSGFYCVNITDSSTPQKKNLTATSTITFHQLPLFNSGYIIKVSNTQTSPIPANTQILVGVNTLELSGVNPNTYNNIELSYNGTILYSWMQNDSSANSISIWTKLPVAIPASSSININLIVGKQNLLNAQTTGEAPQLSIFTTENPSVWNNLTLLGLKNGIGGVLGPIFNNTQNVNGQEATVIYANNSQLLGVPSTTKVFKMWWRSSNVSYPGVPSSVDYAESLNGYNWTMVPGNIVLNCGLHGAGYPTYGNSMVICMQPFVMSYNGLYYLYVNAQNKSAGYLTCLEDVYTSSNGISWTIAGLNETNVCNKPNWIISGVLGNRYVWRNNATGTWYQLEEASGADGWQTGLFTSNNPVGPWTEYGTKAVIGPAQGAGNPEMIFGGPELHIINNTYYVWGQCNRGENHTDIGAATDICLAYTSNVLGNWTYSKYNPVFWRSTWWENATGTNSQVADPSIVTLPNDTTYMFYETVYSQPIPQLAVARSNETLAQILTTGEMNQTASIRNIGYAKYDNGQNVFNKYQNYAGTILWSGINTISGASIKQNNGLEIGINSSNGYSIMTNWNITSPFVYQSLVTVQNGAGATNFQSGIIADNPTSASQNLDGSSCNQGGYITRRDVPGNFYQLLLCATALASSGASGSYPYTSMQTFSQNTTGISSFEAGTTLINRTANSLQHGYVGYDVVYTSVANPKALFVQYSTVRNYPPNGVLPQTSITSAFADGFTASNYNITLGQTQTLTASIVGGSSPYTYNYTVYNSAGTSVANKIITTNSINTSYSYVQNQTWGVGTFTAKVAITDSNGAQTLNTLTYLVSGSSAAACASVLNPLIAIITAIGVVAAVMILLSLFGPVTVMNITIEKMETRNLVKMLGFLVIGLLVVLILFYVVGIGINIIPSTACA